jgi:hypothetical protein
MFVYCAGWLKLSCRGSVGGTISHPRRCIPPARHYNTWCSKICQKYFSKTVLYTITLEVNKWGMFCFDLERFFRNTEVIPGKNVVLCNVLYVFLCNSGQFPFFHVLLNEKHSIYSQTYNFCSYFVVIQWFQ